LIPLRGYFLRPDFGHEELPSVGERFDGTKLIVGSVGSGYIYTSVDSGQTWNQRMAGSWFGVASSADGTKLVALMPNYIYTSSGPVP
jgi:hypothetical protein